MSGRPATSRFPGHEMMNDLIALLRKLRAASSLDTAPSREALTDHLDRRVDAVGATAFAEFAHLQRVAADTLGT